MTPPPCWFWAGSRSGSAFVVFRNLKTLNCRCGHDVATGGSPTWSSELNEELVCVYQVRNRRIEGVCVVELHQVDIRNLQEHFNCSWKTKIHFPSHDNRRPTSRFAHLLWDIVFFHWRTPRSEAPRRFFNVSIQCGRALS